MCSNWCHGSKHGRVCHGGVHSRHAPTPRPDQRCPPPHGCRVAKRAQDIRHALCGCTTTTTATFANANTSANAMARFVQVRWHRRQLLGYEDTARHQRFRCGHVILVSSRLALGIPQQDRRVSRTSGNLGYGNQVRLR